MKVLNFEITSKHAQKALGMVAGLGAGMIVDHYTKGLAKSLKNPVKRIVVRIGGYFLSAAATTKAKKHAEKIFGTARRVVKMVKYFVKCRKDKVPYEEWTDTDRMAKHFVGDPDFPGIKEVFHDMPKPDASKKSTPSSKTNKNTEKEYPFDITSDTFASDVYNSPLVNDATRSLFAAAFQEELDKENQ